ncbi:unnamed protein product, partial [Darwinula stevensoni]
MMKDSGKPKRPEKPIYVPPAATRKQGPREAPIPSPEDKHKKREVQIYRPPPARKSGTPEDGFQKAFMNVVEGHERQMSTEAPQHERSMQQEPILTQTFVAKRTSRGGNQSGHPNRSPQGQGLQSPGRNRDKAGDTMPASQEQKTWRQGAEHAAQRRNRRPSFEEGKNARNSDIPRENRLNTHSQDQQGSKGKKLWEPEPSSPKKSWPPPQQRNFGKSGGSHSAAIKFREESQNVSSDFKVLAQKKNDAGNDLQFHAPRKGNDINGPSPGRKKSHEVGPRSPVTKNSAISTLSKTVEELTIVGRGRGRRRISKASSRPTGAIQENGILTLSELTDLEGTSDQIRLSSGSDNEFDPGDMLESHHFKINQQRKPDPLQQLSAWPDANFDQSHSVRSLPYQHGTATSMYHHGSSSSASYTSCQPGLASSLDSLPSQSSSSLPPLQYHSKLGSDPTPGILPLKNLSMNNGETFQHKRSQDGKKKPSDSQNWLPEIHMLPQSPRSRLDWSEEAERNDPSYPPLEPAKAVMVEQSGFASSPFLQPNLMEGTVSEKFPDREPRRIPPSLIQQVTHGDAEIQFLIGTSRLLPEWERVQAIRSCPSAYNHILLQPWCSPAMNQPYPLTKEQVRLLLLYDFRIEKKAANSIADVNTAFGPDTASKSTAYDWYSRFQKGNESLEDQPRTGRPSEFDNSALQEALEANNRQTSRELADLLGVSHTTILHHLAELGKKAKHYMYKVFEKILSLDLKFCEVKNVEHTLWKMLFYQIIEWVRPQLTMGDQRPDSPLRTIVMAIIQEGEQYFTQLLNMLQQVYHVKLDEYMMPEKQALPRSGLLPLVLLSAQKFFICLGDLARYKEQLFPNTQSSSTSSHFTEAKEWYTKAMMLNAKNGRPYNQLAVISCLNRRKLDAIYYYVRSLLISNPFHSAKESLLSLFDEARIKWEAGKKEKEASHRKEEEEEEKRRRKLKKHREVWVRPDIGSKESRIPLPSEDSSPPIPPSDMNRKFVQGYMHVHAKLYLKINMGNLAESAREMLMDFDRLLAYSPLPISETRILQLLSINMFSIENNAFKGSASGMSGEGYRPLAQEQAILVALEFMAIIVRRTVMLFKENIDHEDLSILLPGIKVWIDWLLSHADIWNPPPTLTDLRVTERDVWSYLADLINILSSFPFTILLSEQKQAQDDQLVYLLEDTMMYGFLPLTVAWGEVCYIPSSADATAAATQFRHSKILMCRDFLAGLDPPLLQFDPSTHLFVSVVSALPDTEDSFAGQEGQGGTERGEEEKEEAWGSSSGDDLEEEEQLRKSLVHWSKDVAELFVQKTRLEREQRRAARKRKHLQAVLRKETSLSRQVEMEVRPHYLVPDTNCFIDHLEALLMLAASPHYVLVVPLVVVNELEGLSRGEGQVGQQASKALTSFLRNVPQSLRSKVRFLTSQGTKLTSANIATEVDVEESCNDDRILSCCLQLCKDDRQVDGVLKRDTVLLTQDRNLRVKALTCHVPVRDLLDFLRWAEVRDLTMKERKCDLSSLNDMLFVQKTRLEREQRRAARKRKHLQAVLRKETSLSRQVEMESSREDPLISGWKSKWRMEKGGLRVSSSFLLKGR